MNFGVLGQSAYGGPPRDGAGRPGRGLASELANVCPRQWYFGSIGVLIVAGVGPAGRDVLDGLPDDLGRLGPDGQSAADLLEGLGGMADERRGGAIEPRPLRPRHADASGWGGAARAGRQGWPSWVGRSRSPAGTGRPGWV
jgi:hypothetical protein